VIDDTNSLATWFPELADQLDIRIGVEYDGGFPHSNKWRDRSEWS
jgi:hypothetical protein